MIDSDTWNRIPEKYHYELMQSVESIQEKYGDLNSDSESKAISAMKQYGLKINEINEDQKDMWFKEVKKIEPLLRGSIIPENVYDTVIELTQKK